MHCPFHVEINNERRKTMQKIKINRYEPLEKKALLHTQPPLHTAYEKTTLRNQ